MKTVGPLPKNLGISIRKTCPGPRMQSIVHSEYSWAGFTYCIYTDGITKP